MYQISEFVKADPEKYRRVFTTSDEKITITNNNGTFDLQFFIQKFRELVPFDIDQFFPDFKEQPSGFREAIYGLFGDMVQHYYDCGCLSCAIPKVRLHTNREEWVTLLQTTRKVNEIFKRQDIHIQYLEMCAEKIEEMMNHLDVVSEELQLENARYWQNFFRLKRCGSGGEEEVLGHILVFLNNPDFVKSSSIPELVSRFPFKHYDYPEGCQQFYFVSGVMFSCRDEEGFLVPEYHCTTTHIDPYKNELTDAQIQDKELVLEFLDHIRFYGETPFRDHFVMTEEKKERIREYPDRYIVKRTPNYEHQRYYSAQRWKEHLEYIEESNAEIGDNNTAEDYFQYWESRRQDRLEHTWYHWHKDDTQKTGFNDYSLYQHMRVSRERYLRLRNDPQHNHHVQFIVDNIPIIYDFLCDKDKSGKILQNNLVLMMDERVFIALLNEARNRSRLTNKGDQKYYGVRKSGSSWSDPWNMQSPTTFIEFACVLYNEITNQIRWNFTQDTVYDVAYKTLQSLDGVEKQAFYDAWKEYFVGRLKWEYDGYINKNWYGSLSRLEEAKEPNFDSTAYFMSKHLNPEKLEKDTISYLRVAAKRLFVVCVLLDRRFPNTREILTNCLNELGLDVYKHPVDEAFEFKDQMEKTITELLCLEHLSKRAKTL